MLTDIFATRYRDRQLWSAVTENDTKLLVQAFRIVNEQLYRYFDAKGQIDERAKKHWTAIHDKLSMELGREQLSPKWYSHEKRNATGQLVVNEGWWSMSHVCKQFVLAEPSEGTNHDKFMKERISFVELAFREREEELAQINASQAKLNTSPQTTETLNTMSFLGAYLQVAESANRQNDAAFAAHVHELNERFKQAGAPLNYHNGFIQIVNDALVEQQLEAPFWDLVKDTKWKNVDLDMKEAIDRRDTGDRDPGFYAAKALESTVKIICTEKGWITGKETGAHNFLDNLGSKSNQFIAPWERDAMKLIFTHVRNPLGHGPGGEEMPQLTTEQTAECIEQCMSWIKGLIARLT